MPRSLAAFVVLCNSPTGPSPFERGLRPRNPATGGGREEHAKGVRRPSEGGRSPPPRQMGRFILSRSGQTVAVLFMASVIIFALMRLIPGDPVLMMLGDDFTQDAYERMRAKLGLDRSIVVQYAL